MHPNTRLRDRYAIVGVGQSAIGKVPGATSLGLLTDAIVNAVADAGLAKSDIDGLVTRGPDDIYAHHQRVGQILGIDADFSTTPDNGGSTQIMSIIIGLMALDAGLCETVVCGYGRDTWARTHRSEKDRMGVRTLANAERGGFREEFGLFGEAAIYALGARRHMELYGTTKEQLGAIAVNNRTYATKNPLAQMQEPMTMEDYLNSRPIVDPFSLFDCCLVTDGAGAVVITSVERAQDLPRPPVLISGFGVFNNLRGWFYDDHMIHTSARPSGEKAYAMAGMGPKDIDLVELYDSFTYTLLAQLEDYGFCAKGEGGPFAASGALGLHGALPCNTSGGQLSEGHLEGMLQIIEGVRQLRREHGPERQVPGAETALVSGFGGNSVCHTSLILKRGV